MKKNILISNIYGKHNLGDYAIRNSALKLISKSNNINIYFLLCESVKNFPISIPSGLKIKKEYVPYGYAIRANKSAKPLIVKLYRLFKIIILSFTYSIVGKINTSLLPQKGFYRFITWISKADIVILMGGGYLVSKYKLTDLFGIILNIIPIYIAKVYRKKIIILPISFGPFASTLHSNIIGYALKNTNLFCRDKISLKYAKRYNSTATFMPDLALYDWDYYKNIKKENYYILTVKEYLEHKKQVQVEIEFAKYIEIMWKKYNSRCIFIPTGANPIEENDLPVANRLKNIINNKNVFEVQLPNSPEETKSLIKKAKYAICTRMHSAIFATTVYTPFIAIAYEHKTIGLMEYLDLTNWYIKMQDVTSKHLENKTINLLIKSNYDKIIKTLIKKRVEVLSYSHMLQKVINF